jgi:predicted ABC-type ATPase
MRQAQLDLVAGRAMLNRIRQSVALGEDIMIETTLGSANWARHFPVWRSNRYAIVLYYLRLPHAEAAVARVQGRVAAGGHDIPDPVIRRRFNRSLVNLEKIYKSIVDEWYVFDSFEDQPPVLAESWRG